MLNHCGCELPLRPGTNYNSKAVIGSGTGIIVTDTSNSQWYAVRLANGSTGYIFAQY